MIHRLNIKTAAPFSVSDAHGLISDLDDAVDLAEEIADFMGLYRVEAPTEQAIALAAVLDRAGRELAGRSRGSADRKDLRPHVVALHELEHDGDSPGA